MVQIFLAPRSNEHSAENIKSTMQFEMTYESVEQYLSEHNKTKLKQNPQFRAWGNTASLKSRWNSMNEGDIILFYAKGKFIHYSRLIAKEESMEFSDKFWGRSDPRAPWPCIFFVSDYHPIDLPIATLRQFTNYAENWDRVQGFMPLTQEATEKIIEQYGSVEKFLSLDIESHYKDTITQLEEYYADMPERITKGNPKVAQKKELRDIPSERILTYFSKDAQKLGKANHAHQDLVNRFIDFFEIYGGICQTDEKSYDLLVNIKNKFYLFEMKSTANMKKQIRAAIAQLFSYEYFYVRPRVEEGEASSIVKCLALDRKPPKIYMEFLDYISIKTFWVKDGRFFGPTEIFST
ncbi:hypothetical protein JW826_03560 [Candidatus Woesearchaeota archaeon]|nr:hypothetical protein [Candidatus Woesearchaeota archaeon]